MKKMISFIVLIVFAIFLVGCVQGPVKNNQKAMPQQDTNAAQSPDSLENTPIEDVNDGIDESNEENDAGNLDDLDSLLQ